MIKLERFGFETANLFKTFRHSIFKARIRFNLVCREGRTEEDRLLQRWKVRLQFTDRLTPVHRSTGIIDAINSNQHFRLDLCEAVRHGLIAHVGRAEAPDRANAGASHECDDGFGNVWQIRSDPVALLNAELFKLKRQRQRFALQLTPANLFPLTKLIFSNNCRLSGGFGRLNMAKRLLSQIDPGTLEPDSAGHVVFTEHAFIGRRRLHIPIVPDALPEGLHIRNGPLPHLLVGFETQSFLLFKPGPIKGKLRNGGKVSHGLNSD